MRMKKRGVYGRESDVLLGERSLESVRDRVASEPVLVLKAWPERSRKELKACPTRSRKFRVLRKERRS